MLQKVECCRESQLPNDMVGGWVGGTVSEVRCRELNAAVDKMQMSSKCCTERNAAWSRMTRTDRRVGRGVPYVCVCACVWVCMAMCMHACVGVGVTCASNSQMLPADTGGGRLHVCIGHSDAPRR